MRLLAPDVLAVTRDLPPLVGGLALLAGALLWLFGACTHRFWLALLLTVSAGLAGLHCARDYQVQPLVAGLLAALSAGLLALALARLVLFLAGGLAGLAVAQATGSGWNEFVCFFAGGLAGVLLYRLWITVLSALVGALLMSHAVLSLLDRLGRLDSAAWAGRNGPLLNWGLASLTLTGVVAQLVLDRRRHNRSKGKPRVKPKKEEKPQAAPPPAPPPPRPLPSDSSLGGWWPWKGGSEAA
jgi:hypothetical protein